MQGSELAKHLRENGYQDLIIIGITADIYALESRHQFLSAGMNGVLIKPLSLMTLENELSRYFQTKEIKPKSTCVKHPEEYSFEVFGNLLRQSPEYILVILEEIKKVHDETLEAIKDDQCDEENFNSLVHKIKGGAQLLNAQSFVQACEALEQEGNLNARICAFTQLLEEQNEIIFGYQLHYSNL